MSTSYDLGTLAMLAAAAAGRIAKAESYAELDQAATELRLRIEEMRRLATIDSPGGNALLTSARLLDVSRRSNLAMTAVRQVSLAADALTETVTLTEVGAAAAGGDAAGDDQTWWKEMTFPEAVIEPGHEGPTGSRQLDIARARYRETERHEAAMKAIEAEYYGEFDNPQSSRSSEKVNSK